MVTMAYFKPWHCFNVTMSKNFDFEIIASAISYLDTQVMITLYMILQIKIQIMEIKISPFFSLWEIGIYDGKYLFHLKRHRSDLMPLGLEASDSLAGNLQGAYWCHWEHDYMFEWKKMPMATKVFPYIQSSPQSRLRSFPHRDWTLAFSGRSCNEVFETAKTPEIHIENSSEWNVLKI